MLGCRPLLSGVGWWSNPCRPCKCPATKLCFLLLLSQKETGRETPRGIACGPPLGTSKEPIVPASLSGSWRPNAAEGSSCPQFQSVFTSNMANLREETLSLSKFSLLLSDLKYKGFTFFCYSILDAVVFLLRPCRVDRAGEPLWRGGESRMWWLPRWWVMKGWLRLGLLWVHGLCLTRAAACQFEDVHE